MLGAFCCQVIYFGVLGTQYLIPGYCQYGKAGIELGAVGFGVAIR